MSKTFEDISDDSFEHISDCIMVDTLQWRVQDIDLSQLPRKFSEVGGNDSQKWAIGQLKGTTGRNSLRARGVKSKGELVMEGSPASHFQGHNIVSSGDATMLVFAGLRAAKEKFDLKIPAKRALAFAKGDEIGVARIDTPLMMAVPDDLDRAAVINALGMAGVIAGLNISIYSNQSVYFDQSSQSSSLKAYDKYAEYQSRRHGKPEVTETIHDCLELASKTIRWEPVYRQKFLMAQFDGRLPSPSELLSARLATWFTQMLGKYDLRRDLRRYSNEEDLLSIPMKFRLPAFLWLTGRNVRLHFDGNERSYKAAVRYLKAKHSINIEAASPQESFPYRIEVGELLRPENFLPVPQEVKNDKDAYLNLDMAYERRSVSKQAWGHLHQPSMRRSSGAQSLGVSPA